MPDSSNYSNRSALFGELKSLPAPQLEQVIVALNAPRGNIPTAAAQPASRVAALFEWVESPVGCGLATLESVLQNIKASAQSEPLANAANQGLGDSLRQDIHIEESVSGSSIIAGDGNTVQIHHHYGLPDAKPAATRKDRNEKILIDAVWTEVEDRLRQSLHNAILVRLDMAEQRNQVSRPWDSQLRTADQNPKNLPPGTHIADMFDRRDVGGKLLILGNPGSGKTTTMLDLAAVLIQRANDDPEQPIPVMVNLSSWQNAKQSLTDWLVNELKLKYGVSQKLGQTWLQEKKLLPLLDGLDELPPIRQEPVVQAVNGWLQSGDGPMGLLVCSRIEEYELYKTNLGLNGAVCLEPLTDNQLQQYLQSLDCQDLWKTLRHDEDLLTLVRTPLLLSVAVLANDGLDPQQWQHKQTTQQRMEYLLNAYIERRLHEAINTKQYPPHQQPTVKQTRHWLTWLAKQIKNQSQDEFSIEQLQPKQLSSKRLVNEFKSIVAMVNIFEASIIICFSFSILLAFTSRSFQDFQEVFVRIIVLSLLLGSALGTYSFLLFGQNEIHEINLFESFNLKFSKIYSRSLLDWKQSWGLVSLITGRIAISSLILSLSWLYIAPDNLGKSYYTSLQQDENWFSLIIFGNSFSLVFPFDFVIGFTYMGGIMGISLGLAYALVNLFKEDMSIKIQPNQGIFRALKLAPFICLLYFSITFIVFFLFVYRVSSFSSFKESLTVASVFNLPFLGLFFVFSDVNFAIIKHLSLRVVLYRAGYIPWNYARFLNHCTDRLLLQRVGGRYRFIHKLVQEHFAAMPLKSR